MTSLSQLESLHRQIVGLRKAGSRFDVGLSQNPARMRKQLIEIYSRLDQHVQSTDFGVEDLDDCELPATYSKLLKSGLLRERFSAGFESAIASSRRIKQLHGQLVSSLAYPLILTLLAIVIFLFLSIYAVPQVFDAYGAIHDTDSLYWLPAKMVSQSGSLWAIGVAIVLIVIVVLFFVSGRIGRLFFWLPGVRAYYRDLKMADFAESVAEQWRNGVSRSEALRNAAASNLDRATARHVLNVVDADTSVGSTSRKDHALLNWLLRSENRHRPAALHVVSRLYGIRANERKQQLVRYLPVMIFVTISVAIGLFYISTIWMPLCELMSELALPRNSFRVVK